MKSRSNIRRFSPAIFPMRWITQVAFVIALAVVIGRFTTPDVLRDPWEMTPGRLALPSSPGPGSGLVFDLLACLPALLVLVRQAIDRSFRIKSGWSHWFMFALTGLAVLSTFWSSDRFAAAVTSAHFLAAAVLLWAMSQLVRSALRFRLVCALSFGLLLVLVVQSALYLRIDLAANISYWNENKTAILKEHNWSPDSFMAKQFEHKLISGELIGFFNSANSFAAAGVLLFTACIGIGFQKLRDGESREWLFLPGIAVVSLIWILVNARSKTAGATPVIGLGAMGLFVLWRFRRSVISPREHARAFWFTVGLIVFAIIAVTGHGLYHHGLFAGHFSNSLDFRWKYWVASAGIFVTHPLMGVGWDNFGLHYLAHRLPEASEEIKDPHNFLIHFFVELGIVGGLLCIAWILRLFWEISRPAFGTEVTTIDDEPMQIKSAALIVLLGILFSTLANIDFTVSPADVVLALLMKPLPYLFALLLGTLSAAMFSPHSWALDDRPAPWIFYCTVTGLGLFLLHNLIDFSWFEANAMLLFMGLLGAARGVATDEDLHDRPRWISIISVIAGILIWIAAASFFVAPVLLAEQSAADADEQIRTAPTTPSPESAAHYHHAADDLATSAHLVPFNSDYVFREAEARYRAGELQETQSLIDQAKQINPSQVDAYLFDANLQLSQPNPDPAIVRSDFDTIIRLNPNDVPLHVEYGDALARFGMIDQAREQYKLALNADAGLAVGEPKRLSPEQIADLRAKAFTTIPQP